jgi:uncharacterized membrane protein YhaH (DUF805 family)
MEQWFFAKDGQQEGPVSAQQIGALAKSGALDPASTLVWRDGLADWKTLAESGILAETAAMSPIAANPVSENPYLVTERTRNTLGESSYSAPVEYPGYGRLRYFLSIMVVTVVFYAILFAVVFAMFRSSGSGGTVVGVVLLIALLMLVVTIYIGLQRLKNLGMSGWAILWTLVPIMNLWIGWRMVACPAGYEHHRTMDTPAKVITGLWVGMIVLSVAANILAVLMGRS